MFLTCVKMMCLHMNWKVNVACSVVLKLKDLFLRSQTVTYGNVSEMVRDGRRYYVHQQEVIYGLSNIAITIMTLSDLRWETAHSFTYCKPFKCDFLYSCAGVDKVSLVMASKHRHLPEIARHRCQDTRWAKTFRIKVGQDETETPFECLRHETLQETGSKTWDEPRLQDIKN